MNVKALAAIVGTLSLGALATGCASNKASEGTTSTDAATKGTESSCKGSAAQKGTESSCKGTSAAPKGNESSCKGSSAAPTPEKGTEGKCGANSCHGSK